MRFLIFIALLYGGYVLADNHFTYGALIPDEEAKQLHRCETDPSLRNTRECAQHIYGDDVLLITREDANTISAFMTRKANAQSEGTYDIALSNGNTAQVKLTRHNPRYCPIRKRTIYDIRGEILTQYVVVQ